MNAVDRVIAALGGPAPAAADLFLLAMGAAAVLAVIHFAEAACRKS